MTEKILDKVLKKNGVVPMDCMGKKYDPNYYEALMEVDDDTKEPGTIVFVAQQGYIIIIIIF